jgi:hypothetical protein
MAGYYAVHGSWDGVASLLRRGQGRGAGTGPPLRLADAGQLYLHTAPLDLGPFLREMVETHQIQAQERGVDWA